MRRDHFIVATETDHDPPAVVVTFDGPVDSLTERLDNDDIPAGTDVDAAVRLQGPVDDETTTGVLSLTRRLTGEYLLEANVEAGAVTTLVDAVRAAEGDEYAVSIERPEAPPVEYTKQTLLVYDADGNLLRGHSLIPSGVEL